MAISVHGAGRGMLAIHLLGGTSAVAAGLGQFANPEGVPVQILRSYLQVHAPSTGAANLSVGIAAAGAAATDIINVLAMAGVAVDTVYNGNTYQPTAKTAVSVPALWTTALFITFTGSADTTGLDATLFVEYLRLA